MAISCENSNTKTKAIEKTIYDREMQKGNMVLSYNVAQELNRAGILTVYYKAECGKANGDGFPNVFDVEDSIQISKSGNDYFPVK